jgi:hypothetical protein
VALSCLSETSYCGSIFILLGAFCFAISGHLIVQAAESEDNVWPIEKFTYLFSSFFWIDSEIDLFLAVEPVTKRGINILSSA